MTPVTPEPLPVAVYTGSFDPITLGHLDVIGRASRIFGTIVVGVGINPDKHPLFSLEERVDLVKAAVAEFAPQPSPKNSAMAQHTACTGTA